MTSFPGNATGARLFAFTLNPKGAGFELGTNTQILQGVLSPGMRVGPDGAIYLTDWIRGWGASGEGRVWKLDSVEGAKSPIRAQVATLLKSDFKMRSVDGLRGLLRHEDQRIRLKAQFELVRRASRAALVAAADDTSHQLGRIHALWGLGQLLRKGTVGSSAFAPYLGDTDPEIRAQAAKMVGDARSAAAVPALLPLLEDAAPRVRFFAAQALGRAKARAGVQPIVRMLASNDDADVYLRQAGVAALANIGDREALAALSSHASRAVRLAAVVALRRLKDPAVVRYLDDRDVLVVTEAARAINDEGGMLTAVPALARVLERPALSSEPLLRRALSANLRGGTAESVSRVAAFAARTGVAQGLRAEAIAILGVWAAPSNLDRVDGHYLGAQERRDPAAARAAVTSMAGVLVAADSTPEVKIALMEAAAKIGATSLGPALLARLRTDAAPAVRVAALRSLQALAVPEAAAGVQVALADADATVRMAAISAMPAMPIADAAKVDHLASVVARGVMGEQQSAVEALARVKGPEAVQALNRLADNMTAGTTQSQAATRRARGPARQWRARAPGQA